MYPSVLTSFVNNDHKFVRTYDHAIADKQGTGLVKLFLLNIHRIIICCNNLFIFSTISNKKYKLVTYTIPKTRTKIKKNERKIDFEQCINAIFSSVFSHKYSNFCTPDRINSWSIGAYVLDYLIKTFFTLNSLI